MSANWRYEEALIDGKPDDYIALCERVVIAQAKVDAFAKRLKQAVAVMRSNVNNLDFGSDVKLFMAHADTADFAKELAIKYSRAIVDLEAAVKAVENHEMFT